MGQDATGDARVAAAEARAAAAEAALREVEERWASAQALAHMGSYDWHIPRDVVLWSDEMYRIYGCEPQSFEATYDRFLAFLHPDDRDDVRAVHQHAYLTGEPYSMVERIVRPDGDVRVLQSDGEVLLDDHGRPVRMRGTCLDITERVRAEEERALAAADMRETEALRRQALELNDNVVQGLATMVAALHHGRSREALQVALGILEAARGMMGDLLSATPTAGQLVRDDAAPALLPDDDPAWVALAGRSPGAGLRADAAHSAGAPGPSVAASTGHEPPSADEPWGEGPSAPRIRVLLADDARDLRFLVRVTLEADPRFLVVGEAADGAEAVRLAEELQPDVVVLDLALPVLDGLQALPRIRTCAPDTAVVVLSGFDAGSMAAAALARGAARYVAKGEALAVLPTVVAQVASESRSRAVERAARRWPALPR